MLNYFSFFQIALAHELTKNFDKAAENIKCASKVLQAKKTNLESCLMSTKEQDGKNDEQQQQQQQMEAQLRSEIDDLAQILADVDQRLVDLVDAQRTTGEVQQELSEYTKVRFTFYAILYTYVHD